LQCGDAIAGFARQLEARVRLDQLPQTLAKQGVIIDNQDSGVSGHNAEQIRRCPGVERGGNLPAPSGRSHLTFSEMWGGLYARHGAAGINPAPQELTARVSFETAETEMWCRWARGQAAAPSGISTSRRVPRPGPESSTRVPPRIRTRSAMFLRPRPPSALVAGIALGKKPQPSSSIHSRTSCTSRSTKIRA